MAEGLWKNKSLVAVTTILLSLDAVDETAPPAFAAANVEVLACAVAEVMVKENC